MRISHIHKYIHTGFPDVSEKLPEEEPAIESLPVVSNNNATIDTPKDERILNGNYFTLS